MESKKRKVPFKEKGGRRIPGAESSAEVEASTSHWRRKIFLKLRGRLSKGKR